MTNPGLTSMVANYGLTKNAALLDQIIETACRLTPEALPRRFKSYTDLQQIVNLRLVQKIRTTNLLSKLTSSNDFRRFIGRVAMNAGIDHRRHLSNWEKVVLGLRDRLSRDESDRREAQRIRETLDEVRATLSDSSQIRVFDLMRAGYKAHEISEELGKGFSEQNIWIIKNKIRNAVARQFED